MNKLSLTISTIKMAEAMKTPRKRKKSWLSESERKRREVHRRQAMQQTRIYLGSETGRWSALKKEKLLKTDREVATFLIDHYRSTCDRQTRPMPKPAEPTRPMPEPAEPGPSGLHLQQFSSSTPHHVRPTTVEVKTPSVSEVSAAESEQEQHMSGVEELQYSDYSSSKIKVSKVHAVTQKGRKSEVKKLSASFVDPFDLSIDITHVETESEQEDYEDPDYEPSLNFSIEAVLPEELEEIADDVAFEEAEYGLEKDDNTVDENENVVEEETVEGVTRIKTPQECHDLSQSVKCIAFLTQLKVLAGLYVDTCKTEGCCKSTEVQESFVGSALYLKWVCSDGHVSQRWCSQPVLNKRLHSGDFLVCATILLSGNNYSKLALWANMTHLKFPSSDQFHRIQGTYLIPTIDNYWANHQREVINSFMDQQLVVLGDGRNDTPGHCAQYCSYTLMENITKKIITIHTLDKRMTDRKSGNMEKAGFQAAMAELQEKGLEVSEVVTDAHLGIGAVMKSNYPQIKHSHDIWHVAKNLGKKLIKLSQKKQNSVLLKWNSHIVNHFWFTCKTAKSYEEFVCIWRSVLHHITNKHEWFLGHGSGTNRCLHGPLNEEERDKPWLHPKQHVQVLKELAAVLLDKRFLGKVGYYLNFRSTADLEGFHQHILMYCAKRYAYTPPVYRARNRLAALDHNMNLDRAPIKNKDGSVRLHRVWNKKSGRWTVHEEKEKKNYNYIDEVVEQALLRRIEDRIGMRKRVMEEDDPRRISTHLAPVEPQPSREIQAATISRFKKQ